jgi:hypothetical protein
MRNLVKIVLPVLKASLRQPSAEKRLPFRQATRFVRSLIDFTFMTQYRRHTIETLQYMDNYLRQFHESMDIFLEFRAGKVANRQTLQVGTQLQEEYQGELAGGLLLAAAKKRRKEAKISQQVAEEMIDYSRAHADFNFPKIHLLSHFRAHIETYFPTPIPTHSLSASQLSRLSTFY